MYIEILNTKKKLNNDETLFMVINNTYLFTFNENINN